MTLITKRSIISASCVSKFVKWRNMSTNEMIEDEIIESESDVTAGHWITGNDAYDLALIKEPSGSYALQMFMKLQFFFEDDGDNKWNMTEKQQFMKNWEDVVRNVWDNLSLCTLSKGDVKLKLKFETQLSGFMLDHWEITVTKIPSPRFSDPHTSQPLGKSVISFNNINIKFKNNCPAGLHKYKQVIAAHEFGHMLGLADEYGEQCDGSYNQNNTDYASIMNIGHQIRTRHKLHMLTWLTEALKKHGIK